MIELLLGMDFQLGGHVHVLGAAEYLGIDHIGDDRLIFAGKVFVQQFCEAVARTLDFVRSGSGCSHQVPPLLKDEVQFAATHGLTIFRGSTIRSNSAALTAPSFSAASFSVRS